MFRYDDVTITDLATFVDPTLRSLDDPGLTISNSVGFHRDTSNHYRDPTKGGSHDLSLEIAGLSGDNEFIKLQHESIWYYGLKKFEKWAFSLRTREGIAASYGSSDFVPLSDRFYAGGSNTLRGYDSRDVGPKAKTFQDIGGNLIIDEQAIGGEFRFIGNLEAKYIVNDTLRMYIFGDAGGVWLEPEDIDTSDLRYSIGIGFGLQVPFLGPLRIDYGIPLNPDDDQGNGQLHLQTSLRF
jgi:outer membrane protein insertion porin family